ncbi:hypothetical protein [Mycobacteroides abscessus]|uniref:hypothetical protein n=1 Tax=Mycobacteroides abscessus TaxID=36809 RepID=UPI001300071A|nr:hypothetical protein [Mycobacteroides abscessus]
MSIAKRISPLLAAAAVVGSVLALSDVAHAEPPGFPDVYGFVSDNPADYPLPLSRSTDKAVRFATPFGYTCDMGQGRFIHCYGKRLPGYRNHTDLPDVACGQQVGTGAAPSGPAYFQPAEAYCRDAREPVLSQGHKIEFQGELCAVGPDFTACRDNSQPEPRGFVLRQDGNSLLF